MQGGSMRVGALLAWALCLASSCGGTTRSEAQRCTPGERAACVLDGCPGETACSADGSGFGPCVCDALASGGTGGVPRPGGGAAGGADSVGADSAGAGAGAPAVDGAGGFTAEPEACPGVPVEDPFGVNPDACAGSTYEVEVLGFDLYIMLDRTVSMLEHTVEVNGQQVTRWQALVEGLRAFVSGPGANSKVGLGVFPYSGSDSEAIECSSSNYAAPIIGIGPAPETGPEIVAYLQELEQSYRIGGLTPTAAALEGGILHAKEWQVANPVRKTVLVLLTDGPPSQCTTDIGTMAAIAREGSSTEPRVATHVIGVQEGGFLEEVAAAGGTELSLVGDSGDAAAQLVEALTRIVRETEPWTDCEFELPWSPDPNFQIDPDTVEIVLTPPWANVSEQIPRVAGVTACDSSEFGGWYYEDEAAPQTILLCPCSCARLGFSLKLTVDCRSKPLLP